MRLVAPFLAILVLALPGAAAPPFTLEQVLSAPFPSGLVASPLGDAVAWIVDSAGVRNIWVATAPGFQGRPVTRFTADDGQELDEIAWNGDSSALVFTRGGSPNGHGEIPNPGNDPAGARQEIWLAALSGESRKIGYGHAPAITHDGSSAAWLSGGQIWSVTTTATANPAQLVRARGSAHNLAWSPDDHYLLFASERGDHALIGVYDARQKSLRYLDPSVDSDRSPSWSPDGTQVAFIRIPTSVNAAAYGAKRTGQPWSIRIASAESGKGHEIWRAEEGPGSVFWPVSGRNQVMWTASAGIVFPWERDGWLHLYTVPSKGGTATLLTPGDFEIEHVSISSDGKGLVYSSNQDDIDRRHVWLVRADGGKPRRLVSGNGLEWMPAPLSEGRVALLHSDAKQPARVALMEGSGTLRDLAPGTVPPGFPTGALVEPQGVVISSADGLAIHGQLFLPAGTGKHPAVVFFHGGSRRQMLLGWHSMQYYNQAYGFNQYLASKGYVVLSVNYRSGVGYGTNFREALRFGPTGASEFNDVMGAGVYLRSRADVDPARIGVWGGSYGGYLTALALARASDLFAAGVDLHGIHDWNLEFPDSGWPPEVKRLAFESSPLATMNTWKSPVLLIQGDDDRNVAFAQTVQVVEALRKQGVPHEQLIFPDEVHEFLLHAHWITAFHAAEEFLDKYLRP